jgi:hypothetical protein
LSYLLGFFFGKGALATQIGVIAWALRAFIGAVTGPSSAAARPYHLFAADRLGALLAWGTSLGRQSLGPTFDDTVARLAREVMLSYRIVFVGLSRRLKKIVKGRYKFRRQYVCVLPSARLRCGFHLIKFCLKFAEGRTHKQRLVSLIGPILSGQEASPVVFMRRQQQKHVLGALRKQYLLT